MVRIGRRTLIDNKNFRNKHGNVRYGIFIPHVRGSGPPRRSIDSQGLFYGITENTTKEDMLLIIFQSLCFELKNLLSSIEGLRKEDFEEIRVIGSACKNKLWLRLKADILERKILVCKADEAVSRGAAILGAYKNGYIQDKNRCRNWLGTNDTEEILPDGDMSG